MRRPAALTVALLVAALLGGLVAAACDDDAAESEAHRALRERIDPVAYHLGLAIPDAATIETATGQRVGIIATLAYEPGRAVKFDLRDDAGAPIATAEAVYAADIADPLVPGGNVSIDGLEGPLLEAAVEAALRLHGARYEVPPLPDNLEAGSWVIRLFHERLEEWLDALEAGDDGRATAAEAAVQGECHTARTFETARWAFLAAPCFEAWRVSALERDGDREQALTALRRAVDEVEATLDAFAAAIR